MAEDRNSEVDAALLQDPAWPPIAEWIEKQGLDSLKARFATAEIIAKEVQTTLTVLLAGLGASARSK